VIDRSEALSHRHEVDAQFLALVCADEELLRAEFDAIIAAAWGWARQHRSGQSAGAPTLPMRNETPSAGRTARRGTPKAGAQARQRSPPPLSPESV
jgi:hypothetical protein